MIQLEFEFMKPRLSLEELMLRTALRDDIVLLIQANYDEWDRHNRIDELSIIYKVSNRTIKDYEILYRYLGKQKI